MCSQEEMSKLSNALTCDTLKNVFKAKMLHCASCKSWITTAVCIEEKTMRNSCDRCYQKLKYIETLESAVNAAKLAHKTLDESEYNESLKKVISCEKCWWKGPLKQYIHHMQRHFLKKRILTSFEDKFMIPDIRKKGTCTYVLKTSCGTFLLKVKIKKQKMTFVVVNNGDCYLESRYSFFIKYVGKYGYEFKVQCPVVAPTQVVFRLYETLALEIDSSTVDKIFNPEKVDAVYVEMIPKEFVIQQRDDYLKNMKCLECKEFYKTPLYTCPNNHYHCNSCGKKTERCTECKQRLALDPMQDWMNEVKYFCNIRQITKRFYLKPHTQDNHYSLLCIYHPWTCHFEKCGKTYPHYSDFICHFQKVHVTRKQTIYKVPFLYLTTKDSDTFYMTVYDRLFIVKHRTVSDSTNVRIYYWNALLVGSLRAYDYAFEIEIKGKVLGKTIKFRSECEYEYRDVKFAEDGIKVRESCFHDAGIFKTPYEYTIQILEQ